MRKYLEIKLFRNNFGISTYFKGNKTINKLLLTEIISEK